MTQIRCPNCGQVEIVDLHGRYFVKCDTCQQEFAIFILPNKQPAQITVTCPQCGHTEPLSLTGQATIRVNCNLCDTQFVFSNNATTDSKRLFNG